MNWWDTATKHNSKPNLKSWVLSWLFMSHFHKWWENRFRCTCGKMQLDNKCLWQAIFLNTSVKVVSTATTLHCHRMSTLSRAATYPNPSNTQAHPGFIFLHGVNLALLSRTHGGQLKPFLGTSSRATLTRKANLIIKQVKVQSWRRHFGLPDTPRIYPMMSGKGKGNSWYQTCSETRACLVWLLVGSESDDCCRGRPWLMRDSQQVTLYKLDLRLTV